MNIMVLVIILFSLLISTFISIWVFNKHDNKWSAMFSAFLTNTFILVVASLLLYKIDKQTFHKQAEGVFGSLGILVFFFFIPIITLINSYTIIFVNSRKRIQKLK